MIYLLHFSRPFSHARHFLLPASTHASALDVIYKTETFARSPLLRAAAAAGVVFMVADILPGDAATARRLRARKDTPSLCSVCREQRQQRSAV